MSYDPNQDPNSGYGNPPYGIPPSGPCGQPSNPYGAPPQGPYGQPQGPYGPPPQGPYGQPQAPYGYGAPPQGPYSAPAYQQPGYGYGAPPVQAAPLPLGEAIRQLPSQYIKVLTKPSAATFAEEMGKGSWGVVWIQLIGIAIIQAVSTFITNSMRNSIGPNPQVPAYVLGQTIGAGIIVVPLFFFIWMGILYEFARAFGGQGTFRAQGYTTLLFYVPLSIISAAFVLILIPARASLPLLFILSLVVLIVALAGLVYDIVLQIFAVMAVHRLSGGKSAAAVLITIGVLVLLFGCLFFAAAGTHPQ